MAIEDELIGRTFCNNNGQEYQVLYVSGKKSNSTKLFRIRFIATGYERDVEKVEIKRGKIKDRYERSVFGIGYLGDVKMVDHKREYTVWSGMLERCYDSSCERYKDYGGAGVTVCDRWHSFENFLEDLPNIEGYDEELFKQSKIFIDKDIKQKNSPKNKKVYSPDTCCFVSRQVNNANRDLTNASNHFIATSPDGEVIYARGLRPFSKKYRLHRTSIQKCLRGEREDYNGWTFKLIKESNYKKKKAEEN
ncbi:hypothetical protein BSP21_023 [Bacillus phage BSP21]|uniref:HNH endonuclease n=1 Tax=Bacillus phage SPG24 TaxID=1497851 RepID=UPI000EB62BB6|nr:HNH endonuclease [Bacillus phage SPG24]ATN94371.1 hypothetical protein BSP9_022 [Bacillus phage BSP9]AYJ75358.1 hypothetical protein BSP21_023 [Bacillus phage BSP21]